MKHINKALEQVASSPIKDVLIILLNCVKPMLWCPFNARISVVIAIYASLVVFDDPGLSRDSQG